MECRRFALAGDARAVVINPAGDGRVILGLIRLKGMKVIERREAALEIADPDTHFHMGCNDSGDILYITSKNSTSLILLFSAF